MIMRYCKTIKIFCFVRTNTSIKSKHKKSVILLENSLYMYIYTFDINEVNIVTMQ